MLHFEPDVIPMLPRLAIDLRLEARDRHARDLAVVQKFLFGLVPQRPLRLLNVRLHHPTPPTCIRRERICAPRAGHQVTGCRRTSLAARTCCTAAATATAAALSAGALAASLRGTAALRVHPDCQTCQSKDSDDQSACSHETPPRKPVEIKA